MERYDSYKNSGIYFLPKLPSNWEIRKGKYLFKEENRPVRSDDEIVTCFRDGQVTLRKNRRTEGFTNSLKEIGYQGVRRGDLVIHNMDAFAGAIGISDSDGKATPVYACCTPKSEEVSQYYYCYLLRYLARNGFILSLAKGIRERSTDFRFNDFKELYLPVPTRKEQDAIVAYLDSATSKIDEAIAQQQKMIDLLNERKQIIINNAVTKGLDPNVKMKPSGIDWIGDIPEHWEIIQYRHLFYNLDKLRMPISADQRPRNNPQYDYYGASGAIDKIDYYNVEDKVLLIGEDGANLLLRNLPLIYKAEGRFWVNNHAHILKPIRDDYDFMAYVMESADYTLFITGSAQPKLSQANLNSVKLPIPPVNEQKEIVNYLSMRAGKIDKTINESEKMISLLQERKQIIINDVVTGKVKVV
jgi:type I restriction enzyme S subunit